MARLNGNSRRCNPNVRNRTFRTTPVRAFDSNFGSPNYYPQKTARSVPIKEGGKKKSESAPIKNFNDMGGKVYHTKNPITILSYLKVRQGSIHPTQKPVDLLRYLIRTYTLEGETVCDFSMGSGSTGIACIHENRNFIGIENDPQIFQTAKDRIEKFHEEFKIFAA